MAQDKPKKARKKRKKAKSKTIWAFSIFWVLLLVLTCALIIGQAGRYNELREVYDRVQAELAQEKARNEEYYLNLTFFDREADIERQARERLGMVRPNEIVFRNVSAE